MKPTKQHIVAISAAIHMYLNGEIRPSQGNNKKLITSWRHAILEHMPYSLNRQIGGWTGKDQYL